MHNPSVFSLAISNSSTKTLRAFFSLVLFSSLMEPDQENPQTQLLLHHHHHHHNHQNLDHQVETHVGIGINGSSSSSGKSGSSTYMCRQSSARWTPTSDQIRILKDLYYNNGVRSPSAEQIQKISARLRQYGKIEGKNVFYWFQNHKARERQKKRFTVDTNHLHPMLPTPSIPPPPPPPQPMQLQIGGGGGGGGGFGWKPTHEQQQHQMDIHTSTTKYMTAPNINPGVSCPSSPCSSHGVLSTTTVGQIGYGSVLMEKSFRDCSISAGGSSVIGPLTNNNLGWVGHVGIDHHHHLYSSTSTPPPPASSSSSSYSYPLFTNTKSSSSSSVQIFQNVESSPVQMETLPLFPIHREQEDDQDMSASGFCIQGGIYPASSSSGFCIQGINPASNPSGGYNNITSNNWYRPNDHSITAGSSTSRTSLELSLYSSYSGMSPNND